jgi:hypothetical protein
MLERRPNRQSDSPRPLAEGKYSLRLLLPEVEAQSDGAGPEVDIGQDRGKLLVLTLSIDHVTEQEGLIIAVWGSPDGHDWRTRPILTLPEKYYCGMYSVLLNLAKHPDVRYLRVEWKMRRWGKGSPVPKFGFSVFTERSGSHVSTFVA